MDYKKVGELVVKAQSGDKKALNDLFGECYGDLYYFALKTVKNEDAAADAVQESAIDIINTIGELKNPEAFVLWSHRIVYCKCTKYFKQSAEICADENEDGETVFDSLKDEDPLSVPENVVLNNELRSAVASILETLPAEQRAAMTLYYFDELSVFEIAAIQEVSEGTVKSRLNYGRKAVKAKVEEYEEKTGTKLHSAFIPFMLKGMLKTERASICAAVPNTVGAAAEGAVQVAAVKAAAAPVIKTIISGGKLVMSTKKLIAIIAASLAVVMAGGVAIGVAVANKSEPDEFTESTAIYESEPDYGNNNKPESAADMFAERSNAAELSAAYAAIESLLSDEVEESETVEESAAESEAEPYPEPTPDEYFKFTLLEDGTYEIAMNNRDNMPSGIVIPSEHNDIAVTRIGYNAFNCCSNLTSVIIPGSVTEIDNAAFRQCTDLETVIIADSVKRIGNVAFADCSSLTEIKYNGTKEQWEAIEKGTNWDYKSYYYGYYYGYAFTIHCTDGDTYNK